jgi:hypothetical protein
MCHKQHGTVSYSISLGIHIFVISINPSRDHHLYCENSRRDDGAHNQIQTLEKAFHKILSKIRVIVYVIVMIF